MLISIVGNPYNPDGGFHPWVNENLQAEKLAIENINSRNDILSNFELVYTEVKWGATAFVKDVVEEEYNKKK